MLKTFDLRERERPLTVYGPPGLRDAARARCAASTAALRYELTLVELEPGDDGRAATATRSRPFAGPPPRPGASATRSSRTTRPGRFDPRARRAARRRRRARTSAACSAARPSTACAPEQVIGPERAPGARSCLRRHRAVRGAARSPRTTPTCSCTRRRSRGGGRARARDRPLDRRARRPSSRATPRCGCSRSRTSRRRYSRPRASRDEARAVFAATVVPRDFDAIEVPFPERGEPRARALTPSARAAAAPDAAGAPSSPCSRALITGAFL